MQILTAQSARLLGSPVNAPVTRGILNVDFALFAELCRVLRERELTPASLARGVFALRADEELRRRLEKQPVRCGNEAIVSAVCGLFG